MRDNSFRIQTAPGMEDHESDERLTTAGNEDRRYRGNEESKPGIRVLPRKEPEHPVTIATGRLPMGRNRRHRNAGTHAPRR